MLLRMQMLMTTMGIMARMKGGARERTRTRPLFVPTQRVGEVEVVFSMKVEEKWRDLTRLPSSAMTLRSGRQESGTSCSGMMRG